MSFLKGQYKTLQEALATFLTILFIEAEKDKLQFKDLWSERIFFDQGTMFVIMKNCYGKVVSVFDFVCFSECHLQKMVYSKKQSGNFLFFCQKFFI